MARVQLKNIVKRWGATTAVERLSLDIANGEFLVLLGPSGCGKTTTMRMVAGLEDPSEGEVWIGERCVNTLEPKDRDVAMVFQSYGLYPNMTVRENIAFPLRIRGLPDAQVGPAVQRAAQQVELTDYLDRRPKELSGGQRQRVALARAIVRQPAVFLMDEPLSNLDAKLRVSMRSYLKHLHHTLGVTTIYVTHDQIEAMTLADRVVVMNKGAFQQVGTPTDIYDNPSNTFVAGFIGSPAMNLVDGEINGGVFSAPNIRIEGLGSAVSGKVTLGFRAEDARRVESTEAAQIIAPVYSLELLGEATLVSVRSNQALIAVKAAKEFRAEIGTEVRFELKAQACHLFDGATGQHIQRG